MQQPLFNDSLTTNRFNVRLSWVATITFILALLLPKQVVSQTPAETQTLIADAFEEININEVHQVVLSDGQVETTITYTVGSELDVFVDAFAPTGDYVFTLGIPADAQDVHVGSEDDDLECSALNGTMQCVAHHYCEFVVLFPVCLPVASNGFGGYTRTIKVVDSIGESARINAAAADTESTGFLEPFTFQHSNTRGGGIGKFEVRIDWDGVNQTLGAPLQLVAMTPSNYFTHTTNSESIYISAGATDSFAAAIRLKQAPPPLLFIPGIAGSKLESDKELWPSAFWSWKTWEQLLLDPTKPITSVKAKDILYEVGPVVGKTVIYRSIFDYLTNTGGYVPYDVTAKLVPECDYEQQKARNPTLFIFPYDWRKSNAYNAELLGKFMECIRQFHPHSPFNILAHSMGGLVARRYILNNPSALIGRVITVGTPWLGTPKAILTLETGEFLDWTSAAYMRLSAEEVKMVTRFFPGFHELLPSSQYFAVTKQKPFKETGWDVNENGQAVEEYDYPMLKKVLDRRYPAVLTMAAPMQQNSLFHTPEQDFVSNPSPLKYYHFYGLSKGKSTIIKIEAPGKVICKSLKNCKTREVFIPILGEGDGTVAVDSATRGSEANTDNITFISVKSGNTEHTGMMSNPDVQAKILAILRQQVPPPNVDLAAAAQESDDSHFIIRMFNVLSPTISDEFGNRYAYGQGEQENSSITATHYYLGSDSHQFVVPSASQYTLTLQVGVEPASLEIIQANGITNGQVIRYIDFDFPTTRTLTLKLPFVQNSLQQDSNEDGNVDTVITPSVFVADALANDVDAPVVAIQATASNSLQQISITAQDNQAGIKNIYYAVDGSDYQLYTAPFTVNPAQINTIYAFAEDQVLNRSSLFTLQLNPQATSARTSYLPIIHSQGNAPLATPTPTTLQPTATPLIPTPTATLPPATPVPTPQVATTIRWDGGGDGRSWGDPLNWSGDALPLYNQRVEIANPPAQTVVITQMTGIVSLQSAATIELKGGGFLLVTDASTLDQGLILPAGAAVMAAGATAYLRVNGTTTLDGGHLFALNGAKLLLPTATTYFGDILSSNYESYYSGELLNYHRDLYNRLKACESSVVGGLASICALGSGSQIDLSGITSLIGETATGLFGKVYFLGIRAVEGGQIDLHNVTAIGNGRIAALTRDAGSKLDLSALANAGDRSYFLSANSGWLAIRSLTNLDTATLDIGNSTQISTSQISTLGNAIVYVAQSTPDFSGLTNINGSAFHATEGGKIILPNITNYASGGRDFFTTLDAIGAGSLIDLPNLATLVGNEFVNDALVIKVTTGGQIKLGKLMAITGGKVQVTAEDSDSLIDMPLLASFVRGGRGESWLATARNGKIATPQLTTLNGVSLYFGPAASLDSRQIGSFTNGLVDVVAVIPDLSGMSTVDGSSFIVHNGGKISLPQVISYGGAGDNFFPTWRAEGAGSVIDGSTITALSGKPAGDALLIEAKSGGAIRFNRLPEITAGKVSMLAEGANSRLDLAILTRLGSDSGERCGLQVRQGGVIDMQTNALTVEACDVDLDLTGKLLVGSLQMNSNSWLFGTGVLTSALTLQESVVSPGSDLVGKLTSAAGLTQVGASKLVVDIGGTQPGITYDQLAVNGNLVLTGELEIRLINSYNPPLNTTFAIITAGAASGSFATIGGAEIGNGKKFTVQYTNTGVTLQVVAAQ